MDVNSLNVADVRQFGEQNGMHKRLHVDDESIMRFIHNLKEYPDNEIWFWNLHFENTQEFVDALHKSLSVIKA